MLRWLLLCVTWGHDWESTEVRTRFGDVVPAYRCRRCLKLQQAKA